MLKSPLKLVTSTLDEAHASGNSLYKAVEERNLLSASMLKYLMF